jgi:YfiH family protein
MTEVIAGLIMQRKNNMKATAITNNTEIVTCPEFSKQTGVKHGFFTRKGGVSSGIYTSLNTGAGSKDDPENVKENKRIALQALAQLPHSLQIVADLPEDSLHTLYQIHSNKVITVTGAFETRLEADGLVTKVPNIVLGILTADCTPVLFSDDNAKVIGAAHAGWKGACGGILENTVLAMQELGAKASNIHAAIGPTIGQASYEVGDDFYERFIGFTPENAKFFIPSNRAGHYMFDLPAYVESRLHALGLASVTNVKRDTCAEVENFFSYRRCCLNNEGDYGRNLSVIALK